MISHKVQDPLCQSQDLLTNLSVDKTNEIISLTHQITQEAVAKARKEERIASRQESHKLMDEFTCLFMEHVNSQGLDAAAVQELKLDSFLFQCKTGSVATGQLSTTNPNNKWTTPSTAVSGTNKQPPSNHQKRKGSKTLPERKGFGTWPARKKMDYLLQVADDDTGSYANSARNFLLKTNKVVRCYKSCCNSDLALFLSMNGTAASNKTNFAPTHKNHLDGCSTCSGKSNNTVPMQLS